MPCEKVQDELFWGWTAAPLHEKWYWGSGISVGFASWTGSKATMGRKLFLTILLSVMMIVMLAGARAENIVKTQEAGNLASSDNEGEAVLSLPDAGTSTVLEDGPVPKLAVGGKLVFDTLGPIIINSDGTTRRITNWDKLTEREREWTLRKIRQRNNERRDKLEADAAAIAASVEQAPPGEEGETLLISKEGEEAKEL